MKVNGLSSKMIVLLLLLAIAPQAHGSGPYAEGSDHPGVAIGGTLDPPVVDVGQFTENLGQWEPHVEFVARCSFGEAVFGTDGVMYVVRTDGGGHRVKVAFDSDRLVEPTGIGNLDSPTSFFFGSDPNGWVSGARSFREILYEDVWPGVDVRYYFHGGALKYDVIVGASADPSPVGFTVDGHEGLDIGADKLDIRLSGDLRLQDRDLVAHYSDGEAVPVRFSGNGQDGGYGFSVDKERGRELVIDPIVMLGSTFLGGIYTEEAEDVEVDGDGNVYVTGSSGSQDYPITMGAFQEDSVYADLVLTKLNYNCSEIIFSTFIGGSAYDFVYGMDLDEARCVYLLGNTYSTDFPISDDAFQKELNFGMNTYQFDYFVLKLNVNGTEVEYSTYVGGSGHDRAGDIALYKGQALVVGRTDSHDFPTDEGFFGGIHGTAIFFMLNHNGSEMLDFMFLDGFSSEAANTIAVDKNGDVAIGGYTTSADFFVTPGAYQMERPSGLSGFVARYSPASHEMIFCTYLGGSSDTVYEITIDDDLNVYAAGRTLWSGPGASFPTTDGALDTTYDGRTEGFLAKLDPTGSRLIYSTLIGGDGDDTISDIEVNDDGQVVVVGTLEGDGSYPLTEDRLDGTFEGDSEGFVMVVSEDGTAPVYSSYLGGKQDDFVNAVDISYCDNIVLAGSTGSADFPVENDAVQRRHAGSIDIFVSVIGEPSPPSAPLGLLATGREGDIALNWTPPRDDGNYRITHYLLHRGTSADNLTLLTVLDHGTRFVDVDVEWGVFYYYSVQATNGKGMGPMSNVASARSVTVPDMPIDLTGTASEDAITLEWEPPAFTGGLPLTGYNIYRQAPLASLELLATVTPPDEMYMDADIVDRTTYVYELAAVTEYGESRERGTVTIRATGPPATPRDVGHTYGDRYINLSWRAPGDDYGLPVSGYNVYRQVGTAAAELLTTTAPGARWFYDEDVEYGTVYRYHVTAVNAKGESEPSGTLEARVSVPPWPPIIVGAKATEHYVRVIWSPPTFDGASPITGYLVYQGASAGLGTLLGGVSVEGRTDVALVFLHDVPYDGVKRYYYITAVNAEGESDPSEIAPTVVLDVPTAPRAVVVVRGDGELTLSWVGPSHDGGTAVRSYMVYRGTTSGTDPSILVTLPAGTLRYVDDTVVNGIEYVYSVTATNLAGEGPPSEEVRSIPAGLPYPPSSVAATSLSGSARLTWQPPSYAGGLPVTGYRVYAVGDGMQVELLAEVGSDVLEFFVDGLENGRAYLYAFTTLTLAGESARSGLVEARPMGPPGAPVGLVAIWMDGYLQLTWSAPLSTGGSPVTGYSIHRDDWEVGNWTEVTLGDMVFADHDIEWEGTYTYTLHAVNGIGNGPDMEVTFTVPKEKVEPPEASSASLWPWLVIGLVVGAVAASAVYMSRGQRGDRP